MLPLRSKKLQVVVREPYAPAGTRYRLLRFTVSPGEKLEAQSMMQEACMFLDGPYRQISVSLGDVATFRVSPEPLRVLGLGRHFDARRRQLAR